MILLHEEQQRESQIKLSRLNRSRKVLKVSQHTVPLGLLSFSASPIAFMALEFPPALFFSCTAGVLASLFGLNRLGGKLEDMDNELEARVKALERA